VTARIDLVPIRGSSPAPATAPNENDAGKTPETPEPSPQSTAPPSTEMIDADEPSTGKRKRIDPASYATPVTPTDTSSSSSSSGGGSGISRDHKYVLLTLGVLAAVGITAGIITALTHETKPAETGTVGSG
ncbi:MAG TPA: hypothetical protein VK459_16860, partial [Polyangiaceae bacterium]|nr:hypothetical protein [Polyangiaceae bacterium]